MQSNPLVSVILLTYNRAEYFKQALESVYAQTYKNIELIIIDHGSNPIYTTELIGKTPPFSLSGFYIMQDAGGIGYSRNKGIEYAKGEFISVLDDDCLYFPNRIERCVEAFENGIDVVHHDTRAINAQGIDMGKMMFGRFLDFNHELLKKRNYIDGNEILLRNSPMIRFDESLKTMEDWELIMKLYMQGKRFKYLKEELLKYRLHPNRQCNIVSPIDDNKSFMIIKDRYGL